MVVTSISCHCGGHVWSLRATQMILTDDVHEKENTFSSSDQAYKTRTNCMKPGEMRSETSRYVLSLLIWC